TVHGLEAYVPPSPRSAAGGSLASFLVRSGGLAGQRLSVKTPVVNIGRADYNDLVVPDPSVSTSHAKLQRREGVWVLVDLDSTNGTFVDGEQVKGDAPLAPGATVRLGDVQLVFEPSDDALSIAKGGGTQILRTPHSTAPNAPPRPASPPSQPPASPSRTPQSPPLRPQPPTPSRPGPRPKRPAAQQPPPKKGKGCGRSAAALGVGGGAIVAHRHRPRAVRHAVPDRPGGGQPRLLVSRSKAVTAHQRPLVRPGAGRRGVSHPGAGALPPVLERDHPLCGREQRCDAGRLPRHREAARPVPARLGRPDGDARRPPAGGAPGGRSDAAGAGGRSDHRGKPPRRARQHHGHHHPD